MNEERVRVLGRLLVEALDEEDPRQEAYEVKVHPDALTLEPAWPAAVDRAQLSLIKADRDEFEAKFAKAAQEAADLKLERVRLLEAMKRLAEDRDQAQASARAWQEKALEEREACAKVAECGHFLHDDAPTAKFGREVAAAIRNRERS